jgi:hypothetical protein
MKRSDLKKIVKDCIKEVLFEEGVLSNLVAEVAFGITKAQANLTESKHPEKDPSISQEAKAQGQESRKKKLLDSKRKMLDAMGNSKMSNVFEGTEPLREAGTPGKTNPQSPLTGRDPTDAGIDISGLFGLAGQRWKDLK